jgi:16S rRNA (adenine1518-N6/adenine1519-N6)-dimethyltransferase
MKVTPKKHLGQHFLLDLNIAHDIVKAVSFHNNYNTLVEIGPGTGVLTQYIVAPEFKSGVDFRAVEIDKESVRFLHQNYPNLPVIDGDFLQIDMVKTFPEKIGIVGNFPYNVATQIFFQVIDHRDQVEEVVCMVQKEVGVRLCSTPGGREYGIMSPLLQAWYDTEYLFTVHENVFDPPPKVKSGVIRIKRNSRTSLGVDEKAFKKTIKQAFSMRRKTLRNCFKPIGVEADILSLPVFDRRAETLSVEEFVELTKLVYKNLTEPAKK